MLEETCNERPHLEQITRLLLLLLLKRKDPQRAEQRSQPIELDVLDCTRLD